MLCGIDEAGRGPVVGPMVVAAVFVESDAVLTSLNVCDSKRCTPKLRELLATEIKKVAVCKTIIVSATEIDTARLHSTMNDLEVALFASILKHSKPDAVYIDAPDVNAHRFGRKVLKALRRQSYYHDLKLISEHRADEKYAVVGAASIIAKVCRDAELHRISVELGMQIGSGYPSDAKTVQFLRKWYELHKTLPPHTRLTWATAKRIQNVK